MSLGKFCCLKTKAKSYILTSSVKENNSSECQGEQFIFFCRNNCTIRLSTGRCWFIYYHTLDSSTEQYFQFIYSDNTLSSSTKKQYFPFIYWQYLQFIYEKTIPSIHLLTILSIHLLTIIPINFINNPHFRLD